VPTIGRLRLAGFKSFVDPTEIAIEAGLTGIVGPNGCGKSNLIEALRWVMGESSARSLRGGDMEDVIFAGNAGRPARTMAEVTIDLDNADGSAPPPFVGLDRIEVSRRIDRGRGSAYRVNGREVRARDVHLLFADAATGARSAALVTQGQVAALIAARPGDRRAVLEEAAGITGLHARRHEAEGRLRAAEDNVRRLEDILATLDVQLHALGRQAKQAARYRRVAAEIRACEVTLLATRWRLAKAARTRAEARLAETSDAVHGQGEAAAAAAAARSAAAARLPMLRQQVTDAASALERLTAMGEGLAADAARLTAETAACRQRRTEIAADLARAGTVRRDADAALARLAADQARITAAAAGEEGDRRQAAAALTAAADALARIEADHGEATRAAAVAAAGARAAARRVSELAEEAARLEARRDKVVDEEKTLTARMRATGEAVDTGALVAAAEAAARAAAAALAAAEARADDAGRETAFAGEAARTTSADVARLAAEIVGLEAVVSVAGGEGPPLIDSVAVPPGLETAVAAALGDDALLPMQDGRPAGWSLLPALSPPPPLPDGVRPLAHGLTAPPALARRLSQTGVVADAEVGQTLQPRLGPGQRLVSAAGDLWRWDGLCRPAGEPTAAAIRLGERQRLAAVRAALAEAEAAARAATARLADARAEAHAADIARADARHQARAADDGLARARQAAAEAETRQAGDAARAQILAETRTALDADIAGLAARRQAAVAEQGQADAAGSHDAGRLTTLATDMAAARQLHMDRRAALDVLDRDIAGRRRRLAAIADERAAWERRLAEADRAADALQARRAAQEAEERVLAERPAALARRRQDLADGVIAAEARRDAAVAIRDDADRHLAATEAALRDAEARLATAREERVRAEAVLAQAEAQEAEIGRLAAERLGTAAGLAPPGALADEAGNDAAAADVDIAAEEARLERLRRERDLIGPVNLRAEDERAALADERQRLDGERHDLLEAVAKLRQALNELDREGRDRLVAAFEAVNLHFRALFSRLFGGGEAHLALTDADDPLATGLEVMASPPGKRLQLLSLLSGGEQTLTALALRFAIFLAKRTPICVLDEVDAPLDDANVARLCALLDDLAAGDTRFLVITHHRLTMARMHRLYGVTMAEPGVSQLVSVDLGPGDARLADPRRRIA
jgi:chromosome segregation protein